VSVTRKEFNFRMTEKKELINPTKIPAIMTMKIAKTGETNPGNHFTIIIAPKIGAIANVDSTDKSIEPVSNTINMPKVRKPKEVLPHTTLTILLGLINPWINIAAIMKITPNITQIPCDTKKRINLFMLLLDLFSIS